MTDSEGASDIEVSKNPDPTDGQNAGVKPRLKALLWGMAAALSAVVIYNLTVWLPASNQLAEDTRNRDVGIHVYRTAWVHPTDITIDLVTAGPISTADLMRALFQIAERFEGRGFGKVTLARKGKAVFVVPGDEFRTIGREYGMGQNPVYLMRTLPERVETPDGTPAFGHWTGGWLGVMTRQMEDANAFGEAWVAGRRPN
jgi:hypothetical protein